MFDDNEPESELTLGDDELETVAAGVFSLEPFIQSMRAQQAMMTILSQTLQGISDSTMSTIKNHV